MITPETLLGVLQDSMACHQVAGGLRVETQCLYPSNSPVTVAVEGYGDRRFVVSDKGGAVDTLTEHGVSLRSPTSALRQFAGKAGLNVSNDGAIFQADVSMEYLPVSVVLVANASKDAAGVLLDRHRFSLHSQFRSEVSHRLRGRFGRIVHENYKILGHSNKSHIFDFGMDVKGNGILLLATTIDEGNSINSTVVSCLDVRLTNKSEVDQRILYDDREEWRSESLLLLEEGAPTLAYSRMLPELDRLLQSAN